MLHCPKCKLELSIGKLREFETLVEHVCDPNMQSVPLRQTYVCSNTNCPASKEDIFWDEDGEYYGWSKGFDFDDNISTAFPSSARRIEIEIYKKGLKSKIDLPPFLMLWVLKPLIEFKYKADEYGTILSRTWELKWLRKEKLFQRDGMGYNTYYSFPIPHIMWSLKNKYNTLNKCSDGYRDYELKNMFDTLPSWDKRWWRYTESWLSKIIFRKWYKKYLLNKK